MILLGLFSCTRTYVIKETECNYKEHEVVYLLSDVHYVPGDPPAYELLLNKDEFSLFFVDSGAEPEILRPYSGCSLPCDFLINKPVRLFFKTCDTKTVYKLTYEERAFRWPGPPSSQLEKVVDRQAVKTLDSDDNRKWLEKIEYFDVEKKLETGKFVPASY